MMKGSNLTSPVPMIKLEKFSNSEFSVWKRNKLFGGIEEDEWVSLKNLKRFIFIEDENRTRHALETVSKQNSAANMVTYPKRKSKPGKTRPPTSAPAVTDTSRKNKKFKGKCYNCNKWGHCASECKQPKRGESSTPRTDNKANVLYQTAPANFIAMVGKGKASTEWWLDSGATCHVCNNPMLLEDVTAADETVTVANGEIADVLKVGTATLLLSSGYGDVHAVNVREMVFVMIFMSFDMILGAYLIGNMTALIVKGSKTERFRDKMKDLIKYMNMNRLQSDIREQIKGYVRLKYERTYAEAAVLEDIPVSIRAKISESLYRPYIESIHLFKGCSSEFIHQIVIRLQEEFFLPGELILEQGNVVDQLYFVCHGMLEGVEIGQDGTEETISQFERNSSFGEIAILCNIPQPFTVRVCELCRLLRLNKQSFINIVEMYFVDARVVLGNLFEGGVYNSRIKLLESDITVHIGRQEAEFALKVNSAASHGDLNHLKGLIRAGADPKTTDYDGRSPLHIAASRGYQDIALFLIQVGVDINAPDKFGSTPLLEAIKCKHDRMASLLFKQGAKLGLNDAGSQLCEAVSRGDAGFLKRVLSYGADANSKDYDHRTPLHIAACEELYLIAEVLVEAGASVFSVDRWGTTPLDEAQKTGCSSLIKLFENAKSEELLKFPERSQVVRGKTQRHKCTVFPFHPWDSRDERKEGIVIWIPQTMEELIRCAEQHLNCSGICILSEDGGKILDINLISDGQKLYLTACNASTSNFTSFN